MNSSNIVLSSAQTISTDAEAFYRDYWIPHHSDTQAHKLLEKRRAFVINKLLGDLAVGSHILELGVGGEGGIIAALHTSSSVHGVDISDSAITACQAIGIPVTKLNCDRTPLPFTDDSFDAVIALEVFEHFSNPQFVLEEVRRVLKPKGTFVVSIPSPYTYHWPRLFYPDLCTPNGFHDFLLTNRFLAQQYDDPFFKNGHNSHAALSSSEKSFSIYWLATKIDTQDQTALHAAGLELFKRIDRHGIRTRPIEALELFQQGMMSAPASLELTTDYLCALMYRVVNGDSREFQERFETLLQRIVDEENKAPLALAILKIHQEADRLGKYFLDTDTLQTFTNLANTHD